MASERPSAMATLRIVGDRLDPPTVNRIMSTNAETSARMGEPLFPRSPAGKQVPAATGTWFTTTERLGLAGPAAHLDRLVTLALRHLDELRASAPDVKMDLSLLVFDPDFKPSDLPADLLRRAVRVGELDIEVPDRDKEFQITAANVASYTTI